MDHHEKVVILAGGYGTRLSEETDIKPKPMIEIGGKPILWHIMKLYSHYGFHDFVICLGYKGYVIKEFFANYFLHQSDVTIDLAKNHIDVHNNSSEPWKVTLVDTGINTMTGGRIKKISKYLDNKRFLMTYGDGVADVNIEKLLKFHEAHGKMITSTAIQPEGRFGTLSFGANDQIKKFVEKPKSEGGWINGGFFVCEPNVVDYINGDETFFEKEPLHRLANEGQFYAYKHDGFWKCMDTLRDKQALNDLWVQQQAPWKIWE